MENQRAGRSENGKCQDKLGNVSQGLTINGTLRITKPHWLKLDCRFVFSKDQVLKAQFQEAGSLDSLIVKVIFKAFLCKFLFLALRIKFLLNEGAPLLDDHARDRRGNANGKRSARTR